MPTATKKCKVCGKEYEYCHTLRRVDGVFRWQDVACCVEHGERYLADVLASRATENESGVINEPADVSESISEEAKHVDIPVVEAVDASDDTEDIYDSLDEE